MTLKTSLLAVALATLPTLGFAMGCNYGHEKTATISCADGTVFDEAQGKCVAVVNS